jgi:hypothetical protein
MWSVMVLLGSPGVAPPFSRATGYGGGCPFRRAAQADSLSESALTQVRRCDAHGIGTVVLARPRTLGS